ncbi:hypothetical protein BJ322DRAFT_721758 [Thelephora terrestris]|uniref:Uncharacterized protein n=1 Tax=Thelephora terrestris TaxID=56493 RepID=A0A9P6HIG5_9AGAM|nr:hypothetical protein BJ322DRAFT_721758 [Thelephora terrestris]
MLNSLFTIHDAQRTRKPKWAQQRMDFLIHSDQVPEWVDPPTRYTMRKCTTYRSIFDIREHRYLEPRTSASFKFTAEEWYVGTGRPIQSPHSTVPPHLAQSSVSQHRPLVITLFSLGGYINCARPLQRSSSDFVLPQIRYNPRIQILPYTRTIQLPPRPVYFLRSRVGNYGCQLKNRGPGRHHTLLSSRLRLDNQVGSEINEPVQGEAEWQSSLKVSH